MHPEDRQEVWKAVQFPYFKVSRLGWIKLWAAWSDLRADPALAGILKIPSAWLFDLLISITLIFLLLRIFVLEYMQCDEFESSGCLGFVFIFARKKRMIFRWGLVNVTLTSLVHILWWCFYKVIIVWTTWGLVLYCFLIRFSQALFPVVMKASSETPGHCFIRGWWEDQKAFTGTLLNPERSSRQNPILNRHVYGTVFLFCTHPLSPFYFHSAES